MAERASSEELTPRPIQLPVVVVERALGHAFVETVCGVRSDEVQFEVHVVHLHVVLYEPGREAAVEDALARGDAVALLVHNLDAVSLEHLKAAYRLLPSEHKLPASILIVREPGKIEFKLSCPTCGQKLWVRDEDKGRAGRCPHCKKTFVLPAQSAYLRSMLMLPDTIPLTTVTQGNAGACRGPIAELAERAHRQARILKSATMRVQVTGEASHAESDHQP